MIKSVIALMSLQERLTLYETPKLIKSPLLNDPCRELPSWREASLDLQNEKKPQELVAKAKEFILTKMPKDLLIEEAAEYAEIAHGEKIRKVSGRPYVLHPFDTAFIVSQISQDSNLIATALCHDIVEDSPTDTFGNRIYTLDNIENKFNNKITYLVEKLTSAEPYGEIPKKGTEEYYFYWRNKKQTALDKVITSHEAILVKTADNLSNVHDFLCDRILLDEDGKRLGSKVFDNFSVSKTAQLGRFTYSSILLSNEYRKLENRENPLAYALIEKVKLLIQNTMAESIDDQDSQTYSALYNDWIRSLEREQEVIRGGISEEEKNKN